MNTAPTTSVSTSANGATTYRTVHASTIRDPRDGQETSGIELTFQAESNQAQSKLVQICLERENCIRLALLLIKLCNQDSVFDADLALGKERSTI